MTDTSRGLPERPMSPHLTVWRWHITMACSILHRGCVIGLWVGAVILAGWAAALAAGPDAYAGYVGLLGSPIGKIRITDPFGEHLARFDRAMDLAELYGVPRIRVFSFYMPPGDEPASHRDEVILRMSELARRAGERRITLFLENEKGIYGDTAARVADVLEAVGSAALRHAFDPANYVEVRQPIDEAEAQGELLHDIEDRHQHQLHQQQPIAPLGPALRRRDDAAGVGVGQHDDEARTERGQGGEAAERRAAKGEVGQGASHN